MKIIFLSFTFSMLLLITDVVSYAQTYRTVSNTVKTRVGNPSETTSDTLSWAAEINNNLQLGGTDALQRRSYNRMMADISNGSYSATKSPATTQANIYWCTYLVIDSFNLAGAPGLSLSQAAVDEMVKFWKKTSGYTFIDYLRDNKSALLSVGSGDAIFFQTNVGSFGTLDHTAIIKDLNIDQRGNGTITTYDSNLPWKTVTYTIANWSVESVITPLIGFGKYVQ